MPPALLDFLQRLQVAYAGQVVAARILQEGPSVLGSNGRVSHLRQSRIAFPALDGVCHNVAELVQVLSAKRFLQAKRTVHAVKFHYGSPEIMRHAHDTFCTDNVRICIMSLVSGELSVDEALCDIEGDAVLDRLPTAKVLQVTEKGWIVEAEVFGTGIQMWVRSQGDFIKVL